MNQWQENLPYQWVISYRIVNAMFAQLLFAILYKINPQYYTYSLYRALKLLGCMLNSCHFSRHSYLITSLLLRKKRQVYIYYRHTNYFSDHFSNK